MLLTVITINYNNASGLERTLQSVFAQTFKGFEYIVIDGGSTDGSKALIEKNAANINYWVSEPDKGIYNAMNKGIKAAKGEYVCFLNSGDTFYRKKILAQLQKKSYSSEADIIFSDLSVIEPNKHSYIKYYPNHIDFDFLICDSIAHPGCLIRKCLFQQYGYYNENLKIVSDWEWFIINICRHKLKTVHSNLIVANFYLDGISSSNQQMHLTEKNEVLNKHFSEQMEKINVIRLKGLKDIPKTTKLKRILAKRFLNNG